VPRPGPARYRGPMRRRVGSVLVAACLLAAAGCNRGDDPTITPGSPGSTVPGSSLGTSPGTAPPDTVAGGRPPPITAPAGTERAHLTGARIGARTGGDRVVFEFDPVVPGYTIDFTTRPVTQDGSGKPVEVEGEALLEVRLENAATARFEGENVVLTYEGPKRLEGMSTSVVTEAVLVGDFEGQVTWVIGLRTKIPTVAVSALGGPSRLVLDLPAG